MCRLSRNRDSRRRLRTGTERGWWRLTLATRHTPPEEHRRFTSARTVQGRMTAPERRRQPGTGGEGIKGYVNNQARRELWRAEASGGRIFTARSDDLDGSADGGTGESA